MAGRSCIGRVRADYVEVFGEAFFKKVAPKNFYFYLSISYFKTGMVWTGRAAPRHKNWLQQGLFAGKGKDEARFPFRTSMRPVSISPSNDRVRRRSGHLAAGSSLLQKRVLP
ncbi:hypothetical protein [Komagataeibacter saccharivorans]|uniref:hypothetical protein n=1 Tax=Komagataeibacter saccharivorans TaxID=265959 RepID=UPI0039EC3F3C